MIIEVCSRCSSYTDTDYYDSGYLQDTFWCETCYTEFLWLAFTIAANSLRHACLPKQLIMKR